ncbi:hypothetical protein ACHAXH_008394 [Discostella pseudostelligera]
MTSRRHYSFTRVVLPLLLLVLSPLATNALQIPSRVSHQHRRLRLQSPSVGSQCLISTQQHSRRSYTKSDQSPLMLFSSSDNNTPQLELENNTSDGNNKSPQKWQQSIQSMKRAILSFINLLITAPSKVRTYYGKLTTRSKIILSIQLLALGLIFGMGLKTTSAVRANSANRPVEVSYSTFLDLVDVNGKGHLPGKHPALKLENVIISKDRVNFKVITDTDKHSKAILDKKLVQANDVSVRPISLSQKTIYAMKPPASQELIDTLREHEVPFRAASTKASNGIATAARVSIFALYVLFLRKMYQTMSGRGGSGSGSEAPGKLATFSQGDTLVSFADIEGIDDAKFEVMELVDTLRNPKKYEIMGARAPTGLLLEGPPGTGKTMLARATAATAGVPLLYCSGSDFVEMFVGRGAARVRNTFARAARLSPCIIFIDELDALGKSRDLGGLGANFRSNDEAEQTLNQLLACMDGLDSSKRVCVLAATNRREVLDPALVRPGRFDRIIKVNLPDIQGRERILRVHATKLPGFTECKGIDDKRPGSLGIGSSVDLSAVAAVTRGLCGADLEFIVNEAAIRAVRRVSSKLRAGNDPASITPTVTAEDFEKSVLDFYEMRKPKGGVGDILSNVLGM